MLVPLGLWVVATDAAQDEAQKERKKLQGAWTVESTELGGQKVALTEAQHWIITGDHLTVKIGDKTLHQGTLQIDPTKKPKAFDIVLEAAGKKEVLPGIYELQGDTWKICCGGKERATEFVSNSKTFVHRLKRGRVVTCR
jgi:uncharacterized protein (TIGR03067 family)